MKKRDPKKRRRIILILFLVIMIPVLIASRLMKHRRFHVEKPTGKIGFHDVRRDQQGLLLLSINSEDALKREMNWVTYFIDKDGGPAAMCDRKEFRKGSWQEDCHTDLVHNFIDALQTVPEFRTNQQ